ncbi:hypothetical protein KEM56_000588 [Ascosphaera pollenicola]|nr:hypothetical protein KEM56_000588 [Ascosphaera pollenicola]
MTYRSRQLASAFEKIQDLIAAESPEQPRYKIKVVEPLSVNHPRTVYDNARSEKEARAVAYGNIKRALSRDTIVIADGMNYIKGWRYQLWCEAKAVQIGTPPDRCVATNEKRLAHHEELAKKCEGGDDAAGSEDTAQTKSGDASVQQGQDDEQPYPPELLSNLIYRYEEPSNSARWDKPLFIIPWMDQKPQAEEIWTSITGMPAPTISSEGGGANSAANPGDELSRSGESTKAATEPTQRTLPVRRAIRPRVQQHQATIQPAATDSNALHAFEKKTSEIVSAIREFSFKNPSVSAALAACTEKSGDNHDSIAIPVPNSESPVIIPAEALAASTTDELAGAGSILSLPRLQRLRRQWISMNRAYVGQGHGRATGGINVDQSGDAFVRFLNAQFEEDIDG